MRSSRLGLSRVDRLRRQHGRANTVEGRLVHDDEPGEAFHHGRVEVFLDEGRRETHVARGVSGPDGAFQVPVPWTPRMAGKYLVVKVLAQRPPVVPDEPRERRWTVLARARTKRLESPGAHGLGEVRVDGPRYRPTEVARAEPRQELLLEFFPEAELAAFDERWRELQRIRVSQPWDERVETDVLEALPLSRGGGALEGLLVAGPERGWRREGGFTVLELPEIEDVTAGYPVPGIRVHLTGEGRELKVLHIRWWAHRRSGRVEVAVDAGDPRFASARAAVGVRVRVELLVRELFGVHAQLERHAIAARRHLRSSPLTGLVLPHLRDVCRVNQMGESLIFGDTALFKGAMPLSTLGLSHQIGEAAAGARWDLPPAGERWPGDPRARAASIVREHVTRHVQRWMADRGDALGSSWVEVLRMSGDLATHRPQRAALGPGTPEQVLTFRRYPEPDDLRRLAQWSVRVMELAIFEQSWLRAVALPFFAGAGQGLCLQWDGPDSLRVRRSPRELLQRRSLVAAWLPRRDHGLVCNLVGEIDPALVAALASASELDQAGLEPAWLLPRVAV